MSYPSFPPLGREWVWAPDTKDETYLKVLRMFEDHKLATFSLHIISQLGVDEGKPIGEWYGPNTVAQVLRWVGLGKVWIGQVWLG